MCSKRQCRNAAGFSLLEVLVAVVIFSVTAMGLVALNKVSMNASVFGRERTAAANLAQFAMTWLHNEVSAYAPDDPPLSSASVNYLPLLKSGFDANGNWITLSDTVRFDEYLRNSTDPGYSTVNTAKYCIHFRIIPDVRPGSEKALPGNLFHASVMITWAKEGRYMEKDAGNWADCSTHLVKGTDTDSAATEGETMVQPNIHSLLLEQILTRDFANKVEPD
ncbi:MAG: prepilin-type N-terminal cleavage/methylation domain-containing protein [Deltaproteobacteria bacterium]|nr:prepilin-type N-terminal cleavage/methylation domain-containing protein [Deltaproteobacteria bacterium]